MTWAESS